MSDRIEWLPVVGYSGLYSVSSTGLLRSERAGGALLKLFASEQGYLFVNLSVDGHRAKQSVHSIVAEAFLGPRPDGQVCRHLDGNPSNNAASNLAWGSYSDNLADSFRHGTFRVVSGEDHPRAKLGADDVRNIRESLSNGVSQSELADRYGVNQAAISHIKNGKSWKHVI